MPAQLRRQLSAVDPVPDDPMTLHITRLIALHPGVSLRFRNTDLAQLDAKTKQFLLDDINALLKIAKFRGSEL